VDNRLYTRLTKRVVRCGVCKWFVLCENNAPADLAPNVNNIHFYVTKYTYQTVMANSLVSNSKSDDKNNSYNRQIQGTSNTRNAQKTKVPLSVPIQLQISRKRILSWELMKVPYNFYLGALTLN